MKAAGRRLQQLFFTFAALRIGILREKLPRKAMVTKIVIYV
jgi:hypothetical protein